MSNKLIRQLFENRLKTWAAARSPALRIAYQDAPFTPVAGETYLECFVLPADTDSQDFAGEHRLYRGVWQITIVKPKGNGLGAALGIEDELAALFPNSLMLSSGSFDLFIRSPMGAGPALVDELNTRIPVSCQYRADTI
nr:phage tail terminator-like protein [Pseudomonas sp. UBA6718]